MAASLAQKALAMVDVAIRSIKPDLCIIDAKAYYAYFAQAEQQDILHKEVYEETGETWVVLDAGSLPF